MMRSRAALAGLLAAAWTSAAAEPFAVEGLWRTGRGANGGRATVAIAPCGEAWCGEVVDVDVADRSRVGTQLLRGLAPIRDGRGALGEVLWPRLGRWFEAGLLLIEDDVLLVEVCVGGGLICPKQRWRRVGRDREPAATDADE